MPTKLERIEENSGETPVRGVLHRPEVSGDNAVMLTHGAGSNCESPLLVAVAEALSAAGVTVLRCDLPYRQLRPHGPPFPAMAARDRAGVRAATAVLRNIVKGHVFVGGHSYGGRQASMVAAEDTDFVAGLLLLSYPLHPPRRPDELRTKHFSNLRTKCLFIHGERDPFGSLEEMKVALSEIPAETRLVEIARAGHELARRGKEGEIATIISGAFRDFLR